MKLNLRKECGITMITVTIAIIILIVITGILIYNARDIVYIKNYNALKNDIELLRNKVSDYYNEYGTIPVRAKCTKISVGLETVFNKDELENEGELYVLDLQALDGLSLNYGEDYEEVKELAVVDDYYSNLYIIHGMTHNIFLNGGIKFEENGAIRFYYTDYDTPDQERVDFRYVDGIKIPDGYYYIGRDEAKDIVISPNLNDTINLEQDTQYYWKKTEEILEDVVLQEGQTMEEYRRSTEEHKGYYVNDKTKKVIYLDAKVVIPGTNDTSPYLPDKDSTILEGTDLSNGLVAIDGNGNEWVWIEVPRSIYKDTKYNGGQEITSAEGEDNLRNIETTLQNYAEDYRHDGWEDVYFNGCGVNSKGEYDELKNKMLKSVFENGGFWIGRYEAGANEYATESNQKVRELVIQKDMYTYNFVTATEAQYLSSNLITDSSKNCSLMFGIQWELICKFIESKKVYTEDGKLIDYDMIGENSVDIGNYESSDFEITSENAEMSDDDGESYSNIENGTIKKNGEAILLTTGASEKNKVLNIYDLAGNQFELTLQQSSNGYHSLRGSYFGDDSGQYISSFNYFKVNSKRYNMTFRPTIF